MSQSLPDPAGASLFFFHAKHASADGKSCTHYRCYAPGPEVYFSANAFRSFRPTSISFGENGAKPDLLLRMRKSFALSGKIDLLEAGTQALRGVVTRGRKIYDAQNNLVGRFDSAKSWKENLGETLIDAAGELIFGNGEGNQTTNGSDRFVLSTQGRVVGSLGRQVLPFYPDPPRRTRPLPGARWWKKVLPRNLGSALFDLTPPGGWRLELREMGAFPDLSLLLGATLMTIEICRW